VHDHLSKTITEYALGYKSHQQADVSFLSPAPKKLQSMERPRKKAGAVRNMTKGHGEFEVEFEGTQTWLEEEWEGW
jgi:hypothetical protein